MLMNLSKNSVAQADIWYRNYERRYEFLQPKTSNIRNSRPVVFTTKDSAENSLENAIHSHRLNDGFI